MRPPDPSLMIFSRVCCIFCRASSGMCLSLEARSSLMSSWKERPKMLDCQIRSGYPSNSWRRKPSISSDCFSLPTMGETSAWMSARIMWMLGALARRRTP